MESLTEKIEELRDSIDNTGIVTSMAREKWVQKLDEILNLVEALDAEDEDDDDEDDEPAAEGDSYLSPKAVFQVSHALSRPRWQVEEDPEDAVLDLCEKVLSRGR